MPDATIHFPVTFLHSDAVRALRNELQCVAQTSESAVSRISISVFGPRLPEVDLPAGRGLVEAAQRPDFALRTQRSAFIPLPADFYVYRMWLDWGREGVALRRFVSARVCGGGSLAGEPLVDNIEEWCDWQGDRAALVEACLRCGVLRQEMGGLELSGFAIHNAHLAPGYVGQHRKGGLQKSLNARLNNIHAYVRQQAELMMQTGTAGPLAAVDSDLRLRALGLVMGIDGAAGREPRRPQDYPPDLLAAALEAVQRHGAEKIAAVVLEVAEHATDPAFATDPQIIIKKLLE